MSRKILFVTGFDVATRARDLAYEFERYGALIRCDVPAPRNPNAVTNPYAFVEFRSSRDAEDAYNDMHDRPFQGGRLNVQWARSPPSSVWRGDRGDERVARPPPPRYRERSRSPRRERERSPPRRARTPERRARSPERRRRSASPPPRRDERDRYARDRAHTPPPPVADRALTPPYERER